MKNASQFLSHIVNYKLDTTFMLARYFIAELFLHKKKLRKTITSVTTETTKITQKKSFNRNFPIKKSFQNCIQSNHKREKGSFSQQSNKMAS